MAQFPDNPADYNNFGAPLEGVQHPQADQVRANGKKQTIDGKSLINQNAPGKLNENRFSSLKPSRNDK